MINIWTAERCCCVSQLLAPQAGTSKQQHPDTKGCRRRWCAVVVKSAWRAQRN